MSTLEAQDQLMFTSVDGELTPDEFKRAFRDHPAGVAVVTADAGDGPVAMTVSSLFSVSAVPPLLAFAASALSSSTPSILAADSLVVHFITEASLRVAHLCATSGVDRFDGTAPWARLSSGEPFFLDPAVRIRGEIVSGIDAGASTIVVVRALEVIPPSAGADPKSPVVYHDRNWYVLGSESLADPLKDATSAAERPGAAR